MRCRGSSGNTASGRAGGATSHRRTGSSGGLPSLKGVDSKLAHTILDEVIDSAAPVSWDEIAGQSVCIF